MSDWKEVEEARDLPGLRLVLTEGVPGPWGEAAKGVFRSKGIPFVKVRQKPGQDNDALFAWTGHRNAPVAVYGDETPRTGWWEILLLAERLAPEPALIPADPEDRLRFLGLAHELMSENGFGWCRRLMLFQHSIGGAEELPEKLRPVFGRMFAQYGYSADAARRAPARLAQILDLVTAQHRRQQERGHAYLMGPELGALDVYWAAMAALIAPLPPEQCAMSAGMRDAYGANAPTVDPALLAHRDRIYEKHLGLPIDL